MNNKFCKEERLCNKVLIESLFNQKKGIKFTEFPFMVVAKEVEKGNKFPAQVMFSVSKRRIRLAVNRNLIKRRSKEAYRLNREPFYNALNQQKKQLILCFIYLDNKPVSYQLIEEKIIVLLSRLSKE